MVNENPRQTNKTCTALKQCLLSLLKTKKLSNITVAEITKRSDVGRSTFYLHYKDIYSLLEDLEEDILSTYIHNYTNFGLKESFLELCTFIKENQNFVQAFHTTLSVGITNQKLEALLTEKQLQNSTLHQYLMDFLNVGNKYLLEQWIEKGCDLPVEEVATILTTISNQLLSLFQAEAT